MLSKSQTYRNAAVACRKTATRSAAPVEWLVFAAEWDNMAVQSEQLSDRESKLMSEAFGANTLELRDIGFALDHMRPPRQRSLANLKP